jgi:hypothetical protein
MRRAARNDEMNEQSTTRLASVISDFADTADVLDTVDFDKAEIPVEAIPDIVAVEHRGVNTAGG